MSIFGVPSPSPTSLTELGDNLPAFTPTTYAEAGHVTNYMSISAQPQYLNFSHEELRVDYYRRHPPPRNKTEFPRKSAFGSTTSLPAAATMTPANPFAALPQPQISTSSPSTNQPQIHFPVPTNQGIPGQGTICLVLMGMVVSFTNLSPASLTGWEYHLVTTMPFGPIDDFVAAYMVSTIPLDPAFASTSTHTPKDMLQLLAPTQEFPEKAQIISRLVAERNQNKVTPGKWVLAGVDAYSVVSGQASIGVLLCELVPETPTPAPAQPTSSTSIFGANTNNAINLSDTTKGNSTSSDPNYTNTWSNNTATPPSSNKEKDTDRFGSGSGTLWPTPSASRSNSNHTPAKRLFDSTDPPTSLFGTPQSSLTPSSSAKPFAKGVTDPPEWYPASSHINLPDENEEEPRTSDEAMKQIQRNLENSITELKQAFQGGISEAWKTPPALASGSRKAGGNGESEKGKKVVLPVGEAARDKGILTSRSDAFEEGDFHEAEI